MLEVLVKDQISRTFLIFSTTPTPGVIPVVNWAAVRRVFGRIGLADAFRRPHTIPFASALWMALVAAWFQFAAK
jgi:hypothetical protein